MPTVDKVKRRQQMKAWRKANPEKVRDKARRRRERDRLLGIKKPYKYRALTDEQKARASEKAKARMAAMPPQLKLERNRLALERVHRINKWFRDLKSKMVCSRCSETFSDCLEFHHLNPLEKEGKISSMWKRAYAKEVILAEISKCIVLCANCHRKEHARLRQLTKQAVIDTVNP